MIQSGLFYRDMYREAFDFSNKLPLKNNRNDVETINF